MRFDSKAQRSQRRVQFIVVHEDVVAGRVAQSTRHEICVFFFRSSQPRWGCGCSTAGRRFAGDRSHLKLCEPACWTNCWQNRLWKSSRHLRTQAYRDVAAMYFVSAFWPFSIKNCWKASARADVVLLASPGTYPMDFQNSMGEKIFLGMHSASTSQKDCLAHCRFRNGATNIYTLQKRRPAPAK